MAICRVVTEHYPELMEGTADDWRRVWLAIDERRQLIPMALTELYDLSMSEGTFRKMAGAGIGVARKDNRIKICRALGWTDDSIERLLRGSPAVVALPPSTTEQVLSRLNEMADQLRVPTTDLLTRLDGIAEQVGALQVSHQELVDALAEAVSIRVAADVRTSARSTRAGTPRKPGATDTPAR